jgi:FkbM family methyltransferase
VLNLAVGSPRNIDGKVCILTKQGSSGHAVYGPYQHLDPGRYAVEFNLAAAGPLQFDRDEVCAAVDVAAEFGRVIFAREDVALSRLRGGPVCIRLVFHTRAPWILEFRVAVTGRVPLLIEDYCRVLRLVDVNVDSASPLDATRFPDPLVLPKPIIFLQHLSIFRGFYEYGAVVKIIGNDVVVTIDGVSFYARVLDDLRFIDEIFLRNTYNFLLGNECCVIDIGMNIGLVSLRFAQKAVVKEVHSFEPLRRTYDRARANLSLNPEFARKIFAYNIGLADTDEEKTILINDAGDSGAFTIGGSAIGTPEHISIRNAATVLKPIVDAAKSNGRDIIAKVDCEGSEFPIFTTLEEHGLLADISVFMVEWHRGVRGKTQRDLITPLIGHGFVIFDLAGKAGNGFFYAVRRSRSPS